MPQWSFAKKAALILFAALVYGAIIEGCQELFTASRKADVYDVLANVSGSILAILTLRIVENFRKKKRN